MKLFRLFALGLILITAACSAEQTPQAETQSTDTAADTAEMASADNAPVLEVYKSPTCGCCADWITHMEEAGFAANIHHPQNLNLVKEENNITPQLRSCHTAIYDGKYFFEGHVPAKHVEQFLANPPEGAIGLTVPGMPVGSPGMEMGERFDPYKVIVVMENGDLEVYADVSSMEEQY